MSQSIVIFGNCHGRALTAFYRQHLAAIDGRSVSFVHARYSRPEEYGAILREADIVLVQKMWFPFDVPSDSLKPGARRYYIPTIACRFLWPFAIQAHPQNAQVLPSDAGYPWGPVGPTGRYAPYGHNLGDSYLNRMIDAQEPAEQAVRKYLELDIAREANLDRLLELSIDAGRRLDSQTDFDLTGFLERHFRDVALFLTPGHLNKNMFAELARQVFKRFDVPGSLIDQAVVAQRESLFGPTQLPIHPGVIEHFGLRYVDANSQYRYFDEGYFTFAEYAARYLRCEWNRELAEGIAFSVGQDLQHALDLLERGLQRSPNSFRGLLSRANVLLRIGRTSEAEASARRAMQIAPADPDGPKMLSAVLRTCGDRKGAEAAARHSADLDNALTHQELASLSAVRSDMDRAVQSAQQAATLGDTNGHLHAEAGDLALRSGDLAAAEQAYRKAVELDAAEPSFRARLIEALARQGKRYPARAMLRDLAARGIADSKMFWQLGQMLVKAGDLNGAEQAFRKVCELDVTTPGLGIALEHALVGQGRREEAFVLRRQVAVMLIGRGKHEEALGELRQLVAEDTTDQPTYVHLGQMLLRSGDASGAELAFRRALEFSPILPQFRRMLADALYIQGKHAEALTELRQLASDGTTDVQSYVRLGRMLVQARDLDGAERAFRQATELDPTTTRYRAMLADVIYRQGNREQAIAMLRELAVEGTGDMEIYAQFGHMLSKAGDLDGAERALRKAAELDPAASKVRSMLGEVLDRQGKRDEALGVWRGLATDGSTDPQIYSRLGQTLLRSGDLDGAEQAFRRALELSPKELQLHSALVGLLIRQNRREDALGSLGEMVAQLSPGAKGGSRSPNWDLGKGAQA